MSFSLLFVLLTCATGLTNAIYVSASNDRKAPDFKVIETKFIEDLKQVLQAVNSKTIRLYNIVEDQSVKQCPPEWTKVEDLCFYLQPYWKTTWSGAQSSCLKLNANLVVMDSEQQMNSFLSFLTSETLGDASTTVWIGGFEYLYEDKWYWIDGSPLNTTEDSVPFEEIEFDVTWPRRCLTWTNGMAAVSCEEIHTFVCVRGSM